MDEFYKSIAEIGGSGSSGVKNYSSSMIEKNNPAFEVNASRNINNGSSLLWESGYRPSPLKNTKDI